MRLTDADKMFLAQVAMFLGVNMIIGALVEYARMDHQDTAEKEYVCTCE